MYNAGPVEDSVIMQVNAFKKTSLNNQIGKLKANNKDLSLLKYLIEVEIILVEFHFVVTVGGGDILFKIVGKDNVMKKEMEEAMIDTVDIVLIVV